MSEICDPPLYLCSIITIISLAPPTLTSGADWTLDPPQFQFLPIYNSESLLPTFGPNLSFTLGTCGSDLTRPKVHELVLYIFLHVLYKPDVM